MSRRVLDKNFCVIPWTGFEVEPNGDVKNCIISKDVIGNLKENSIEELIGKNSSIKQEMLLGKFPKSCEGCYLQEKHRGTNFDSISSRLYYAKEITPHIPKDLLEPMLMKENKEFLELLLKHNPDVHIRVNTNLSKTKTGVFDLLCQFKNVHWTVSVESTEKEFEYIRFHGVWKDFLDNLKIIRKTKHKISLNMLYFVLNYKSIFNTIDFFKSLDFHDNSFVLGPLYTPDTLNILNLPKKVLNECKTLYQKQIDKKTGFLLQNSYENVLSYLTDTKFHANIEATKQTLKIMDLRRNIDSKKVFPELYERIL